MRVRTPAVVILAAVTLLFGWPASLQADTLVLRGRDGNDEISFGYGESCRDGLPCLLICRKGMRPIPYTLPTTPFDHLLVFQGAEGDDLIRAVSNSRVDDCVFGDIDQLRVFYDVRIEGGPGRDRLIGTPWADVIRGGPDNDKIAGGGGDDSLYGDGGSDYIFGGDGDDFIAGGMGDDYLMGQGGADTLLGGGENDSLSGGTGLDPRIDGGPGSDTFVCRMGWEVPYDNPATAYEDCGDGPLPISVSRVLYRDPYTEWAAMWESWGGYITSSWTTSATGLLLSERAAGASLVMESGGDLPVAGDFDGIGGNDLAVFRSAERRWFFDHGCDGDSDDDVGPWGLPGDRPVAGDFDRDGRNDDVAVFRPATRRWYYDHDHDGSSDPIDPVHPDGPAWSNAGDLPLALDFDRDGKRDDLAVFRPSTRRWYFDRNHDGSTDPVDPARPAARAWGAAGDIPLAGDFDRDGFADDVAVFRPSTARWYYDWDHDGDTDPAPGASVGPWGVEGDIPVAGDFDGDGFADDVAVFRPSTRRWYHDWDHDGDTDPDPGSSFGPWGTGGEPLHTVHKQYPDTCGPSSLAMVLKALGLDDPGGRLCVRAYLNDAEWPSSCSSWIAGGDQADVGYRGSTEHVMSLAYRKQRELDPSWDPGEKVLDGAGMLITGTMDSEWEEANHYPLNTGGYYQIAYDIGDVRWDAIGGTTGRLQQWLFYAPGAGWSEGTLPWVADHFAGTPHARPYGTRLGEGRAFYNLNHLKEVLRAFLDRGIPLVASLEDGGHINAIIGYWAAGSDFWIYTADPLDGWGRDYSNKPMRWRKIPLTPDALQGRGNVIPSVVFFGHAPEGCATSTSWAKAIDLKYRRYRVRPLCP